jgi:hypothetical protein
MKKNSRKKKLIQGVKKMKKVKLFSIILAITMIAMPAQMAFAGVEEVTGDGKVYYVDPSSRINVVLPTSASLGFTLDPQNLAAIQGVGEWKPEDGGSIIPHAVGILVNQSAVPVSATVQFTLDDDAGDIVLLDSPEDVNDGTDKNIFMSFVPANAKTSIDQSAIPEVEAPEYVQDEGAPAVFAEADLLANGVEPTDLLDYEDAETAAFGQFVKISDEEGEDEYYQVEVPAHEEIPATEQTTVSGYSVLAAESAATIITDAEAGTELAYVVDKADYYVVKDSSGFELVLDNAARNDNFDTASFIISGVINKNADWSGYDEDTKITLKAVYTVDPITDYAYDTAIASKLALTYNSIETTPPVAPSIEEESFAIEADTPVEVEVDLGSGTLIADNVTSVTYENEGTQTLTVDEDYTFSGTTLTFTAEYVNSLIGEEIESRTYTVTFNNGAGTTDTVTLTYTAPEPEPDDTAPSIEETEYTFTTGQPVEVTVDLGSGELAATGIDSILYLNSSGQEKTLDAANFTFAGTTLTFKAAYIDSIITANVTERDYTIVFDDAESTEVVITLTKAQ